MQTNLVSSNIIRNEHVLIFFASIAPKNLSKFVARKRIEDYRVALKQVIRLKPSNWQIIVCENTLQGDLSRMLRLLDISDPNLLFSMTLLNEGEVNKGIGELEMMASVLKKFPKIFESARTVSYLTGRRILTNQYLFERTENLSKSALISNPDFFYLDGNLVEVEKDFMYNDMFFTMKIQTFLEYQLYFESIKNCLATSKLGSEQILFNFVKYKKVDFEWLNNLGLLRWEYKRFLGFWIRDHIHLC